MNIMIINHYAGGDKYGMEFRPFYMGRELVKLGHDVTIIAADCSHLRMMNPVVDKPFTEEIIDGVRFVFVKTVKYKKNSIRRLLNVMSFLQKLRINSKKLYYKYLPDVIVASSTYPYDVKIATRIARFNIDTRICYEIHDIWPLSLIELYKLSTRNPGIRHLQRAEIYAYENADTIISILPHVDRHIEELGFHDTNYVYIPNGVVIDKSEYQPAPSDITTFVQELHKKGKFVLMYLGGFSKANALEDLIESSRYMHDDIHILMIGDGPLKDTYVQMLRDQSIKNVTIMHSVIKNQVHKTLRLSDALYIGAKKTRLYKYGVGMNKIFDYMLSKRPIINGIEASNDPVAEADCGISIKSENPQALANAAKRLMELTQDEREAMGNNGYNYVKENHNYEKLAKRFALVLQ